MGKITQLIGENGTLTTAIRNLAFISSAAAGNAASNLKLKRLEISQSGTTTLQMIRGAIAIQTGTTVTATSATPQTIRPLGGAASGLAGNTSPAGGAGRSGIFASVNTTPGHTDKHYFNFANLNGYLWKPAPDEEIWIPPSTLVDIYLLADPTTLTGWTVVVTLEED